MEQTIKIQPKEQKLSNTNHQSRQNKPHYRKVTKPPENFPIKGQLKKYPDN